MVIVGLNLSVMMMLTVDCWLWSVAPGEEVFARNGSKARDLGAPAAWESENPFELQNNGDCKGKNLWWWYWMLYLVSEWVPSKEVDEEVWGGVEDEEDVHHDDAVEEPEGQVVHSLLLTSWLGLDAQSLVQAREHSEIVNLASDLQNSELHHEEP